MTIDPISDMLTRIRNAFNNQQGTVEVPASKLKESVLRVLKAEGYIADFKKKVKKDAHDTLLIELAYQDNLPGLRHIERISRPGLRIYSPANRLPKVLSGLGLIIVSTPKGVMSGKEARRKGIGGEIICRVW